MSDDWPPLGYDAWKDTYATLHMYKELGEFILPYEAVRRSPSPDRALLSFVESTYAAGATLGGWDRAALERPGAPSHDRSASV